MRGAMTAISSSPRAADALEAQPILGGAPAASHLAGGGGSGALEEGWQPAAARSWWRQFVDDPLVRTAAVNLALIATW